MNACQLSGRLARDPEFRFGESRGRRWVRVYTRIAVDRRMSRRRRAAAEAAGEPTADFFALVAFGDPDDPRDAATFVKRQFEAGALRKGTPVEVTGRLACRPARVSRVSHEHEPDPALDGLEGDPPEVNGLEGDPPEGEGLPGMGPESGSMAAGSMAAGSNREPDRRMDPGRSALKDLNRLDPLCRLNDLNRGCGAGRDVVVIEADEIRFLPSGGYRPDPLRSGHSEGLSVSSSPSEASSKECPDGSPGCRGRIRNPFEEAAAAAAEGFEEEFERFEAFGDGGEGAGDQSPGNPLQTPPDGVTPRASGEASREAPRGNACEDTSAPPGWLRGETANPFDKASLPTA
ncbi:MAG: single-stranded DNA-binding protein [Armatimonadetes bacterium]|nr:single-stranded DNA-binding protein [Armatimonadota bacterium]